MAKFSVSFKDLSKCCESFSGKSRWTTSRDYRPQITSCCNRAVRKTHKGRLLITWGPAHKVITRGLWGRGQSNYDKWHYAKAHLISPIIATFNISNKYHATRSMGAKSDLIALSLISQPAINRTAPRLFLTFFSPNFSTLTSRTDSWCKNQYSLLFKIWRECLLTHYRNMPKCYITTYLSCVLFGL